MNPRGRGKVSKWWRPKDDKQRDLFEEAKKDIKTCLTVTPTLLASKAYDVFSEHMDGTIKYRDMGFESFGDFLYHCDDVIAVTADGSKNIYLSLLGPVGEGAAHIKDFVDNQKRKEKQARRFPVSSDQLLNIRCGDDESTDEKNFTRKVDSPVQKKIDPPIHKKFEPPPVPTKFHSPISPYLSNGFNYVHTPLPTPSIFPYYPMPHPSYMNFQMPADSSFGGGFAVEGQRKTNNYRKHKDRRKFKEKKTLEVSNIAASSQEKPVTSRGVKSPIKEQDDGCMETKYVQKISSNIHSSNSTSNSSSIELPNESQSSREGRKNCVKPVAVSKSNDNVKPSGGSPRPNTTNVDHIESKFSGRLLGADEYGYVYVHICDPKETVEAYDQLAKSLREEYSQKEVQNKKRINSEDIKIGLHVVVHVDRAFVRGKIFEYNDELGFCLLHQIDYGTLTSVPFADIYLIQKNLTELPPRVFRCMIEGTDECMCSDQVGHAMANCEVFPDVVVTVSCEQHPSFKVPVVMLHTVRSNHDILYLMRRYGKLALPLVDPSVPKKTHVITEPQQSVLEFLEERCYFLT